MGTSKRRRASTPDAGLRTLSDEQILDFLDTALLRLSARREATGDAASYAAAVAALELEACRRELAPPSSSPHEPATWETVFSRLHGTSPIADCAHWERLLAELDLFGLWRVYAGLDDWVPQSELCLAALAHVCLAVDRILYGEDVARARQARYAQEAPTLEARTNRLYETLEDTFGRFLATVREKDRES